MTCPCLLYDDKTTKTAEMNYYCPRCHAERTNPTQRFTKTHQTEGPIVGYEIGGAFVGRSLGGSYKQETCSVCGEGLIGRGSSQEEHTQSSDNRRGWLWLVLVFLAFWLFLIIVEVIMKTRGD